MDKEKVVHTYKGMSLSLRKEGNHAICDIMDEPGDITLSEISQPQKDKYCMIPLI